MKYFYSFLLLALLFSCKDSKEDNSKASNDVSHKTVIDSNDSINKSNSVDVASLIRANEKLKPQQVYTDIVEFVEYDETGEFPLFIIKKNNQSVSLVTEFEKDPKYTRGDIFEMKWKIDSLMVGGEEGVSFTEWLISAKKVKDGSVSLFRKKHPKPMKYNWAEEDKYSTEFKDYLYTLVEYYLANSKSELVKANLKDPDLNLTYSIEDREEEGRSYTVLGIANEFENRTSIMQWLYVDNATRVLYEYDLANEKLIEFK
jgi:hypothetical protein